jgi:alkylation response protein AidB-like acyl-CoA dehydrogenase
MSTTIDLSEEQAMLLDQAASFARDAAPVSRLRARIAADDDGGLWRQMVELGWAGIAIPAEHGGVGLGLAEVAPVIEMLARNLAPSPLFATTLATQAILTSASTAQQADWLPRIAAGEIATLALTEDDGDWDLTRVAASAERKGDRLALSGTKCFVLDAARATRVIASVRLDGRVRLVVLDGAAIGAALSRESVIDETRHSYRLVLDGLTVDAANLLPNADLAAIGRAALLLTCAEISGGLAGALNVTVDYLKTRKQFGKLIGGYQALKHPAVEMLIGLERARSFLYHATTLIARGEAAEADIALRMAKAQGSEAFAFAGDRAVQFHGGFGFTYDCDAQLYLRRALWCQYQYGDERYHRQALAPLLLDGGLLDGATS